MFQNEFNYYDLSIQNIPRIQGLEPNFDSIHRSLSTEILLENAQEQKPPIFDLTFEAFILNGYKANDVIQSGGSNFGVHMLGYLDTQELVKINLCDISVR